MLVFILRFSKSLLLLSLLGVRSSTNTPPHRTVLHSLSDMLPPV